MNDHEATGSFCVRVWGDWQTVIGEVHKIHRDAKTERSAEVYESVLEQKPYDEDDADYSQYRIRSVNPLEICGLIQRFHQARLSCDLVCEIKSDRGVEAYAATGFGMGRKEPNYSVSIDSAKISADMTEAISQAISILKKVK